VNASFIATSGRLRCVSAGTRELCWNFGSSGERSMTPSGVGPHATVARRECRNGRPAMTP